MRLPIFFDSNKNLMLMQTGWSTIINPVLNLALVNGNLLMNIALVIGDNVIDHLLGRNPQGWFIVDVNAASSIYRSAAFNDKTLTLNSSAICEASIYVF